MCVRTIPSWRLHFSLLLCRVTHHPSWSSPFTLPPHTPPPRLLYVTSMRLRAWSSSRRKSTGSPRAVSPTPSPNSPSSDNPTPVRRRKPRFSAASAVIPAKPAPVALAPTLDLSFYPHVVDAIFNTADCAALLALRRTCRSYRRRVDSILARHIAISYRRKPLPVLVVTGALGSIPGVASNWPDCGPPTTGTSIGHLPRRLSNHVLLHTKVVDVRGHITPEILDVGPRMGHIPVVRFRENTTGYRPKATHEGHDQVVAFVTLDPDTDRGQHLCPVPNSARELVATLRCIPGAPAKMPPFDQPECLTDVTLIFRTVNPGRNRVSRKSDFHLQQVGLVRGLAQIIAERIPHTRYTIVGLEKIDLVNAGFIILASFGPIRADYIMRKLVAAIVEILKDLYPEATSEAIDEALACIQFKTFDDYRASLPRSVFKLVTEEEF